MPAIPELSPTEFRKRWQHAAEVTLLGVREPVELDLAALDGALHIPMREVPSRLAELDPTKPLVVMCRGGSRSRRVAEFWPRTGSSKYSISKVESMPGRRKSIRTSLAIDGKGKHDG